MQQEEFELYKQLLDDKMIHPDLAIPRMFAGVSGPVINDIKKVYTLHVESTEPKSSKLTRWWKRKVGDISFAFRWKVMPKLRNIKRRLKDFGLVLRKACRRIKWFICRTSELDRCIEDIEYFVDNYVRFTDGTGREIDFEFNNVQIMLLREVSEKIKAQRANGATVQDYPKGFDVSGVISEIPQGEDLNKTDCGYKFECTCGAYPEQYDVYKNDQYVAYVRMRHGNLSVNPVVGGDIDFETEIYHRTYEDKLLGIIPDNERENTLKLIENKITEYLASKNGSPENRSRKEIVIT